MKKQKNKKTKYEIVWGAFILRIGLIFVIFFVAFFGYFVFKIYNLEKKIFQPTTIDNEKNAHFKSTLARATRNIIIDEKISLRGAERERINILLLGMGGEGHQGKDLTDTIMLVSVNPKTYEVAFLSIPRDLYVKIPGQNINTKINAVYAYGLRRSSNNSALAMHSVKEVVQEVTGQKVDYYVALDFEGFKKIIDEVGGINVEVKDNILDTKYPGPNYSYQTFQIDKGFHLLDGETALKFARVRRAPGGDFGRAARQQEVLASTKKKAFSLGNVVNPSHLNNFIEILGDHLKTDVAFSEIPSFVKLAEKINIYQSNNKVLDAWSDDALLASSHLPLGGVMAYVLLPRSRSYEQIYELAENIFNLNMIERKKAEIEKEKARVAVFSPNRNDFGKISQAFRHWGHEIEIKKDEEIEKKCLDESVIFSEGGEKIFTLDDIASKIKASVKEEENEEYKDFDILVCLSQGAMKYFDRQILDKKDEREELQESTIMDERGNILYNESE